MGRKLIRRWYFNAYRKARPLDAAALGDWYTAQLLARLTENRGVKESASISAELKRRLG